MAFIINGERVEDEVIEEEFESIKEHYLSRGEAVCCDRDEEFWSYARENVVNRILLEQASVKKFGEINESDVDAKFQQILAEHGGEDSFYEDTGFGKGDEFMLRRKVKSGILVDRYLDDCMGDDSDPDDADLEEFYRENIDSYQTEAMVEVSQLFVEPSSHEAAKETYDELCEARKEMLEGGDFVNLAVKHSGLEADEINMGYVQQGQNMPEIEAMIFSMQPGEVSPILATPFGFHLFKVTGRKEPESIPREDIPDLEETFLLRRREDSINAIIEKLKSEGSVEEVEAQPA